MKSGLVKGLIATPIGGGSIFLTMQLTNQADTALSLGRLDLEDLPKVPEPELEPTKKPPSEEQKQETTEQNGSGEQGGGTGGNGNPSSSQPSSPGGSPAGSSSNSSSSSQKVEQSIEDRIKHAFKEMGHKIPTWSRHTDSFTSIYELISRVATATGLLEELKNQQSNKE